MQKLISMKRLCFRHQASLKGTLVPTKVCKSKSFRRHQASAKVTRKFPKALDTRESLYMPKLLGTCESFQSYSAPAKVCIGEEIRNSQNFIHTKVSTLNFSHSINFSNSNRIKTYIINYLTVINMERDLFEISKIFLRFPRFPRFF